MLGYLTRVIPRRLAAFLVVAAHFLLPSAVQAGQINSTVSTRVDFYPDHADGTASEGRSVEVKVEGYHDFDESRLVGEFVGRMDAEDSGRRIIEARQAYFRTPLAGFDFFIGNRQEFWGKAESKNVVDVINQSDAAASQGKSAKLGAPSVSAERYFDFGDLQLWYISDFREKTFNDSDAHPSAGLPVTTVSFERDDGADADDFAARLSTFSGNWDFAASAFYGTARDPIVSTSSSGAALQHHYPLQRSIGLEAQFTGDATLLKWESLHGHQGSSDFIAGVTGVEYTLYGVFGRIWDLGLIGEIQHDDRPQSAADQFGVGGVRLTVNDVAESSLLLLVSADREADQTLVSLEATRRLNEWTSIELSGQFFNARTPSSSFGLLSDDDAVTLVLDVFF